eukprot:TRINITY_DN11940_c0_g1_i5.p1 TRINITY_DN11940_c0_g1~~TRINITY_DN11940_c0_g1_i5.p1  ORF type:complete len:326 (+),score=101.44 TRINITY_DN11940_c0_g1_i5:482-1459(+)
MGWQDFGTPSMTTILNIVKLIDNHINQGRKIAIHCHAGMGRTGLVIACFLVYHQGYGAEEAVNAVRSKRPLSIQTRGQVNFISKFQEFMDLQRIVYPYEMRMRTDLTGMVERQRNLYQHLQLQLDGHYYHPIVMLRVLDHLKNLSDQHTETAESQSSDEAETPTENDAGRMQILTAFAIVDKVYELDSEEEEELDWLKSKMNLGHFDAIEKCQKMPVLVRLLVDFLALLSEPMIPNEVAITLYNRYMGGIVDTKANLKLLDNLPESNACLFVAFIEFLRWLKPIQVDEQVLIARILSRAMIFNEHYDPESLFGFVEEYFLFNADE